MKKKEKRKLLFPCVVGGEGASRKFFKEALMLSYEVQRGFPGFLNSFPERGAWGSWILFWPQTSMVEVLKLCPTVFNDGRSDKLV